MKKFLIRLSYTVFPLWVFAVVVVAYHALLIYPNMQDDMGRLGIMPTRLYYEKPSDTMPPDMLFTFVDRLEELKKMHADVLVCGDSFSKQMPYGFVNYLAHAGYNTVNSAVIGKNPFQRAWDLMEQGYMDSLAAHTVVIETVERSLVSRLLNVDFQNGTLPDLGDSASESQSATTTRNGWSLIEAKNFMVLRVKSFLFEKMGLRLDKIPIYRVTLSSNLFSGDCGTDLYVYCDDVNSFSIEDSVSVQLKKNVDIFFAKAQEKHLNLIILVCPDKYDMYQEYIVKNPFPPKTVNEDFRRLVGDNPNVVIGKELLLPHLHAGEKDLYYWDDTHWSYKSAKIVADTLNERIRNHHPSPIF